MVSVVAHRDRVQRLLKEQVRLTDPKIKRLFFSRTRRFILARVASEEVRDGMLKLLVRNAPAITLRQFKREILLLDWFRKNLSDSFCLPRLFDFGFDPEVWYLSRFIAGQPLHDREESFLYSPERLRNIDPKAVTACFAQLKRLAAGLDLPAHDRSFLGRRYEEFAAQLGEGKHRLSELARRRLMDLFLDPPDWLFATRNIALVHYDLSPANVLVRNDGSFVIIDWENVARGHFLSDPVNFWARSFSAPSWQAELVMAVTEKYGQAVKDHFDKRFLLQSVGVLNYLEEKGDASAYDIITAEVERLVRDL